MICSILKETNHCVSLLPKMSPSGCVLNFVEFVKNTQIPVHPSQKRGATRILDYLNNPDQTIAANLKHSRQEIVCYLNADLKIFPNFLATDLAILI